MSRFQCCKAFFIFVIRFTVGNSVIFRPGKGSYGPEQLDPSLCTHIIYAWAHLDEDTFKMIPGNDELDVENGNFSFPFHD